MNKDRTYETYKTVLKDMISERVQYIYDYMSGPTMTRDQKIAQLILYVYQLGVVEQERSEAKIKQFIEYMIKDIKRNDNSENAVS